MVETNDTNNNLEDEMNVGHEEDMTDEYEEGQYDRDFGEELEDDEYEYEDDGNEDDGYENDGYEDDGYEDDEYEEYDEEYDEEYNEGIWGKMVNIFNSIDPTTRRGLILGLIIASIVLIVTPRVLNKLGNKNPKIPVMWGINADNLPIDEEGNIINPVYDNNGELLGIPVHESLQDFFGEYYFVGQDVKEEEPFDLEAWENEQTQQPGQSEEPIEEPATEEPVNYDIKISELPSNFYSKNPDNSKIKETNYRNLGIEPRHKSENNFIVYNWQGTLSPLDRGGDYINRDILGRILDFDMFTGIMSHTVEINNSRENTIQPPAFLSNDFDRELAIEKAKEVYKEIKTEGVYKDLELKTEDYVINYIINLLDSSNKDVTMTEEYFIPNAEFDLDKGDFQIFQHDLMNQILRDLEILPSNELTQEYLGKVHYKIYNYVVNDKLNNYKQIACDELNAYRKGLCSSPRDISTLEIKSDFIQDIYSSALIISTEHYYYVMYRVYDVINKVIN